VTPLFVQEAVVEPRLRINEIFYSVQGESTHAGRRCVFVRLTGCPLRCRYCDTEYAFHEGEHRSLDSILEEVARYRCNLVEVTGGEPLAQPAAIPLLQRLVDSGYEVLLETSGAFSVRAVPEGVLKIVDFKTPDSGEEARNDWSILEHLRRGDEIKFVITSRRDYEWARSQIRERALVGEHTVLLSPEWNSPIRRELAEWMLEDALPARYQLQLHKLIWPGVERGV
jgi:7-carboxy-7-deazaguanine synthase